MTWVLPCHRTVPVWLRGKHHTLAVRLTTHPVSVALCDRWGGPLVSSSANIHGRPAAQTPLAVRKAFNGQLDYILHGTQAGSNQPSQIRNGLTRAVRSLRDKDLTGNDVYRQIDITQVELVRGLPAVAAGQHLHGLRATRWQRPLS